MDSLTSWLTESDTRVPRVGDVIIKYHSRSGRATRILSSEEYKASLVDDSDPTSPPDDEPWLPFRSQEDFEFAELVHDAALNRPQIERFLKLFQRCQEVLGSLTFQKYDDLKESLENASQMLTPVTIHSACALNPHRFTQLDR